MTKFEVVDSRRWMCGRMARALRMEHQAAALRVGVNPHRSLREVYDKSYYRRAWLIDGHLSGLGGAIGTLLSPAAFVWVALTERATGYPVEIVREARRQIDFLMQDKVELVTTLIDGDEAAKRLLVFLGFHVDDYGPGAAAGTRYGRRRLSAYIDHEAPRMPFGTGHAIRLGYHPEAH